jgi:hypothetical protein
VDGTMTTEKPAINPSLKKRVLFCKAAPIFGIAFTTWLFFLLDWLFGIDVIGLLKRTPESFDPLYGYLYVSIGLTFFALVYAPYAYWKGLSIVRNAVEVLGTTVSILPISLTMARVKCQYTYEDIDYSYTLLQSLGQNEYSIGDSVTLIIDSTNPANCMEKNEIFSSEDVIPKLEA